MALQRAFLEYSCLDSACTLECHNAFWPDLFPDFEPAYQMTIDILEPLMFMQTRGIKINRTALEATRAEILKLAAEKQENLNQLCGRDLNVNSPKDCQTYFYVELGIPPYYNEGSVTVDDLALQRLSRGTAKRPGLRQAKLVQEIRGLQKLNGTYLELEFDTDNRLRCSYNPRGTKFGRLSSSKTIFGTGCLMPEAEVLTPAGWIRIDKFKSGSQAMEWDPRDGSLSWGYPGVHIADSCGLMWECNTEQHRGSYTPDHRIPTMSHRQTIVTDNSALEASRRQFYLPIAGSFRDGDLNLSSLIRVIVMIQADGSVEDSNIRLSFTKSRKIDRCIKLLSDHGIAYTEQTTTAGYRRFCINSVTSKMITSLIGKEKLFGSWLLSLDQATLDAFIDEIQYWDAHIRGRSFIYFTTSPDNANWVATIAHLTGRSATSRVDIDNNSGYGQGANKPLYSINIKPRSYAIIEPKHWTPELYNGPVYCLKTNTSYFLVRYRGFIAITGNTNMQNLPQEFKRFLEADGVFVEIDKRQAEWVVVAYLSGDANMISVVESEEDTHIHTAHLMFGLEKEVLEYEGKLVGNNTDPDLIADIRSSDPILARFSSLLPRTMSGRQCGKKSNHGLNYDEGPNKFALINEMEQAEAKRIVEAYHSIYPGIRLWYESVKRQLQRERSLTNCFGRKVRFMDAWGPDLWKAAYSMLPQSTVVDSLNQGMVKIYHDPWISKVCDVSLAAQIHDSILLDVPREVFASPQFAEILRRAYHYVSPELCYNSRRFKIATDAKVGLNWGQFNKENNPTGMKELKDLAELPALLESWNVQGTK